MNSRQAWQNPDDDEPGDEDDREDNEDDERALLLLFPPEAAEELDDRGFPDDAVPRLLPELGPEVIWRLLTMDMPEASEVEPLEEDPSAPDDGCPLVAVAVLVELRLAEELWAPPLDDASPPVLMGPIQPAAASAAPHVSHDVAQQFLKSCMPPPAAPHATCPREPALPSAAGLRCKFLLKSSPVQRRPQPRKHRI